MKDSLMLQTIAKIVLPPAILFAVYLLFRGHNLPGGGFVAGLMTAAAVILQYVAGGRQSAGDTAPFNPVKLIPVGLLFAIGTGVVPMLLGYPFLTSTFTYAEVPLFGEFELASALFFDLAVFFVVTGVTLSILLVIEE